MLVVALVHEPLVQMLAAAGAGITGAQALISYVTLRATIPPDELLGRVGSTARMLSIGLTPIGVLVGGVLLQSVGGSATLVVIGVLAFALAGLFALSATQRGAVAGRRRPHRVWLAGV